ncbi:hypothetical protein ACO2RV_03670 [Ancylobacter sp. VNQ12]|uniref:hypothetical protein n=1 Tax=Ancylobacter sp. VNQ12 TaxID=3400920 RepID=UPI003C113175
MGRSGDRAKPPPADADIANADIANAMTAILLHSEAIRQHVTRGTGAQSGVDHSTDHIMRNVRRIWARLGDPA